ncbi:MAG: alpha/beta fold hydrolase [bacterium]
MPISRDGTAYQLNGDAAAPALALIHGLGLNRHLWRAHVAALSQRYRVLAYDLLGHGDSASRATRADDDATTTPLTLSTFAAQLRALLDEIGIARCAIAGFSLGGMINRRFAIDYPERARALAIFNSPHERSAPAQREVEARAAQAHAGGPGADLEATLERWFTPRFRAEHDDCIAQVRRWLLANDPLAYAQSRRVLARGVVELIRPQPPIAQPALVMTAEHDRGSTPAMARAIAAEIRGAHTIIVPCLQHMALVESPQSFTEPLLTFLAEVDASDA